jgi:hypothetical protein
MSTTDDTTTPADDHDRPGARPVPPLLRAAWETAVGAPDPLEALGATRALKAHLSTWEAQLAQEAVADGASWATVGEAVGVSRQAAWERFHDERHELRERLRAEAHELRHRHREELHDLARRYRDELKSRRPRRPT